MTYDDDPEVFAELTMYEIASDPKVTLYLDELDIRPTRLRIVWRNVVGYIVAAGTSFVLGRALHLGWMGASALTMLEWLILWMGL